MLYKRTIGSGKDLVLLHGWGFSSALFDDLAQRYKRRYRITTIDLPGHGHSPDVGGGLEEWCCAIIKILPKNPILLGWSLGGLLGIHIAAQLPISRLILLASTPKFVQDDNWKYGIDANNFQQFANTLKIDLAKGLKRFVSLQSADKAKLVQLNLSIDTFSATTQALNQGLEILLNNDLVEEFKQLNLPIKVILGKRDTLVRPQILNWYAKIPVSTQLLDTGHIPFLHKDFKL